MDARQLEWLHDRELLALLQNARHPALRKAYAALTSANPPHDWPELASRVGKTEQWIRKLIKREFSARVGA